MLEDNQNIPETKTNPNTRNTENIFCQNDYQ